MMKAYFDFLKWEIWNSDEDWDWDWDWHVIRMENIGSSTEQENLPSLVTFPSHENVVRLWLKLKTHHPAFISSFASFLYLPIFICPFPLLTLHSLLIQMGHYCFIRRAPPLKQSCILSHILSPPFFFNFLVRIIIRNSWVPSGTKWISLKIFFRAKWMRIAVSASMSTLALHIWSDLLSDKLDPVFRILYIHYLINILLSFG